MSFCVLRHSVQVVTLFIAVASLAADAPFQPCARASGDPKEHRMIVVISDTHFGLGPATGPPYHPYEDFRWSSEFAAFLTRIREDGQDSVDLVLNGDTFELWQPLDELHCTGGRSDDDGCKEDEARERLTHVLDGHPKELAELRKFANAGTNRVIIVPGNHDAGLLFPSVRDLAIARIGAKAGRVEIPSSGNYLSCGKRVYAEHGHQLDDVNALQGWPIPFRGLARYLARPWGENFVASFYNRRERQYEGIDNIAGTWNGVRYGMAAQSAGENAKTVGQFAKYLVVGQSIRQFTRVLGEQGGSGKPPEWDTAAIRRQGELFLVESVPTDDPSHAALKVAYEQGHLGLTVSLTDEEINDICDIRYAQYLAHLNLHPGTGVGRLPIRPCAQKNLMAGAKKAASLIRKNLFLSRHLNHVDDLLREEKRLGSGEAFDIAVFSHTHSVEPAFDPNAGTSQSWHPRVVNTGAWQRIGTKADIVQLADDKDWSDGKVLQELKPEMLPNCYSAVLFDARKTPDLRVVWWEMADGGWDLIDDHESRCHLKDVPRH